MSTPHPSRLGVGYALAAAALFGASAPVAKVLVGRVDPILLAALLYLGSGSGLLAWQLLAKAAGGNQPTAAMPRAEVPWLAGAILFGGVVAPVLLMVGLARTPGSTASLLLNMEGVLTALLAWFVFRENFDRRIALGMAAIAAGGVVVSWQGRPEAGVPWGAILIAAACLGWAIDNNLTRRVSAGDPVRIAAIKGLVAGAVNLGIATAMGAEWPGTAVVLACGAVGLAGYGISLTLFVVALRSLGTARTGAYFSVAPFVGAAVSIPLLGDHLTPAVAAAATLMALGVWLHVTETHAHAHRHEEMFHEHSHVHDDHHRHEHAPGDPPGEPHAHPHRHAPLEHSHPHYPDIHHRHEH